MRKTSLNVSERFLLRGLLPKEGRYTALKLSEEINRKLDLSSEEISDMNVRDTIDNEGKPAIQWDKTRERIKILEFNDREYGLVVEICMTLHEKEEKGKLPREYISLYEKFVIPNLSSEDEEKRENVEKGENQ